MTTMKTHPLDEHYLHHDQRWSPDSPTSTTPTPLAEVAKADEDERMQPLYKFPTFTLAAVEAKVIASYFLPSGCAAFVVEVDSGKVGDNGVKVPAYAVRFK
jgi:hypothetical protein